MGAYGVDDRTGVLTRTGFVAAERTDFDALLRRFSVAPLTNRVAVAAVGSNAAADTLRRKLARTSMVVPVELVDAHGLRPGVSAHVSRPGYVPATPVPAPDHTARLVVTWLDAEQLSAMDATEPNYRRIRPSTERFRFVPVTEHRPCEAETALPAWVYASRHGWLLDASERARELLPQPELLAALLAESKALCALAGSTPHAFVDAMRSAELRERARLLFVDEGRVCRSDPLFAG